MDLNSPFANLTLLLQERISSECPEVLYIDQDLGQLEDYGDRPAVLFPCVLTDMDTTSYENLAGLVQTADGEIVLRLGFAPYSSTNQLTPVEYRKEALYNYELEWKLVKAIHGWSPAGFGYMIRKSAGTERRTDSIRVREIRFTYNFEDSSCELPTQTLGGSDFNDDFNNDFGGAIPGLVINQPPAPGVSDFNSDFNNDFGGSIPPVI